MAPSEADRHELYTALSNALGSAPAETLMSHLLPTPLTELVTRTEFRDEMNSLRSEMNSRLDRVFIAQISGFAALVIAIFLN